MRMVAGEIVVATNTFTPVDTYETVNGCGDDMCDCSDYERPIGPQMVTEGHDYKIDNIWNGIVNIECMDSDFASHDVYADGFWGCFARRN